MRRTFLAMLGLMWLGASAHAQATRTWVSGVGNDANPCSRTAPCKTWAGAISKTAAGGEIDALDPGGFGALTITKSITLDGGGGQVASVLVSATNGIIVAAGASDVVILRNLRLNGLLGNGSSPGTAGINGIRFLSGAQLVVDNCDIFGFNNNGVDVALGTTAIAEVRNSTFRNNAGSGVSAVASSGFAVVQVINSSFVGSTGAARVGVTAGNGGAITVTNSSFQDLSVAAKATGTGILNLDNSLIATATTGISTAAGTTLNVSNNSLYDNGTAFSVAGASTSTGNNRILGTVGTFAPGAMTLK